jgi:hypothetical protein
MSSISIPDELFTRLASRAAEQNVTVEQLVTPLLESIAKSDSKGQINGASPFSEWKKNFEAWMANVHARSNRYPPGFVMDDSRDSIYAGCGE